MTEDIKITLITVVFNSDQTIEDCLESVFQQSYPCEYIIIDGSSVDSTMSIINKYSSKISKIVSEPDNGIYDAMNKGIAIATGDVIGFLNADDVFADETVLEQVAMAFKENDIDACYANLVYVDQNNLGSIKRYWRSNAYRDGLFEKGWVPAHPTFYARRSVYANHGGFDVSYRLAADYEIMLRFLAYCRIRALHIPKVFVKMRLGGSTNRSIINIIRQNIEIYHSGEKYGIKISPIFLILKFFNRISQFLVKPE